MPDPSGEPTPPSVQPPGSSRPSAPAGAPSPLAPAPRTHLSTIQHAKPASKVPPPPPGSRAVLEWLREYGKVDLDPDETISLPGSEDARSTQSRLPREQRKFHKFDPDHPQPSSTSVSGDGPPRAGGVPGGRADADPFPDEYPRGITAEQLDYIRRLRANAVERRLWIALSVAIIAFLAVTCAFLANRFSEPKPTAPLPDQPASPRAVARPAEAPVTLSPGTMDLLDQAMVAETAADYAKAIQLFGQAQHEAGHVYGLNYHLASLCYKANEMTQVFPLLDLSISDGEEVAACYSLRGTLLNQSEGTSQEPGDLEKATRLEPLNARFFFSWGEALRRAGKPELALPQLQRAVERVQEPALAPTYLLKLHLTQIELEQGDALNGELAEKLKEVPPASDWLLTSAALEMQRGDYPAAAQALDKMRAQVGDRELLRQLKDVFFKRFTRQPELSRFFDAPVSP